MNYSQVEKYLSSLIDREKAPKIKYPESLIDFRRFLEKIGNPQSELNGFLVGGTKGKGSTANFIDVICRSCDFRTGLFTSPHLLSYRERIRINGHEISEKRFSSLIGELAALEEERSVFEILTASAFILFKRKNLDFSIFEVGLGGRLDTTNTISPAVSIITPISLDHTQILGNTLEEIAEEKAFILREEGINISAPQKEEVKKVLKNRVGRNLEFLKPPEVISVSESGTEFIYKDENYHIGPIGRHQAVNASLSILACRKIGIKPDKKRVKKALKETQIPGRFQIIHRKPYIIIDGAHNVDSIRALKDTIKDLFQKPVLLIFSCAEDKDLKGMLKEVKSVVNRIYPTANSSPRARTSEEIREYAEKEGIKCGHSGENPLEVLKYTLSESSQDDVIIITGSFYLLGDILKENPFI